MHFPWRWRTCREPRNAVASWKKRTTTRRSPPLVPLDVRPRQTPGSGTPADLFLEWRSGRMPFPGDCDCRLHARGCMPPAGMGGSTRETAFIQTAIEAANGFVAGCMCCDSNLRRWDGPGSANGRSSFLRPATAHGHAVSDCFRDPVGLSPCGPMRPMRAHAAPCQPHAAPCGPMPTPCDPMPTPCDPMRPK
jgi:hypothetical protein